MIEKNIIAIPIEYEVDFRRDSSIAWQSFGSDGHHADSPYFENISAIHNCVQETINPFDDIGLFFRGDFRCAQDDLNYRFMHVDLAHTSDSCGIAMCYVSEWKTVLVSRVDEYKRRIYDRELRPVFKFDFIGRITPPEGGEIEFSQIRELIYELDMRGFDIQLITYDRFQSIDSVQILRAHGFNVSHLSMDRTATYPVIDISKKDRIRRMNTDGDKRAVMSAWRNLKSSINTGRILLPFYQPIAEESAQDRGLMYASVDRDSFGNKGEFKQITQAEIELMQAVFDAENLKIKEPPNGSIDLIEAIAGAAFNASNNVEYEGHITEEDKKREKRNRVTDAETHWEEEEANNQTGYEDEAGSFFEDTSF